MADFAFNPVPSRALLSARNQRLYVDTRHGAIVDGADRLYRRNIGGKVVVVNADAPL